MYGAADGDRTATVLEMDEAAWDRVIRINLTGAFLMVKAAIPAMIARGGGSVILIASQLGRVASPGRPAYCATKGALIQLAKVLAADHAAQGIRANTLSPGAIETRRMLRRWKDMDEARRMMGPKHLLGRLGLPEEIARAAVYLASDASAFMTGSDLLIDGGYTAVVESQDDRRHPRPLLLRRSTTTLLAAHRRAQPAGSRPAEHAPGRCATTTRPAIAAAPRPDGRAPTSQLQVLSPAASPPYAEKEADAVEAARLINDAYADLARSPPGPLRAFVSLPLPHVDASLREMERGLDQLGMLGVSMNCSCFDRSTADAEFEPLYEEMNRRGDACLTTTPSRTASARP